MTHIVLVKKREIDCISSLTSHWRGHDNGRVIDHSSSHRAVLPELNGDFHCLADAS